MVNEIENDIQVSSSDSNTRRGSRTFLECGCFRIQPASWHHLIQLSRRACEIRIGGSISTTSRALSVKMQQSVVATQQLAPPTAAVVPSQAARKQNAALGKLTYERVEGTTTPTHVYATYPLKFLHPRGTVRQGYDTFITVSQCAVPACKLICRSGMDGYVCSLQLGRCGTHCKLYSFSSTCQCNIEVRAWVRRRTRGW